MPAIHPPSIEYWPSGPPACQCSCKLLISQDLVHGFPKLVAQINFTHLRTLLKLICVHIGTSTGCTASMLKIQRKSAIKFRPLQGVLYWYSYIEALDTCIYKAQIQYSKHWGRGKGREGLAGSPTRHWHHLMVDMIKSNQSVGPLCLWVPWVPRHTWVPWSNLHPPYSWSNLHLPYP